MLSEHSVQVMNDPRMLQKGIRMTVFDLPSHGRSFPPEDYFPGEHYNSEDRYIEVIAAIIKSLGLKRTIVSRRLTPRPGADPVMTSENMSGQVCGASMAGLICIAVALRNAEVGAAATIPVQGCE
jgi:pimeloyl-ACP methyl ester carboxylesterase